EQAKEARSTILDKMLEAIPEVRSELNVNAPRISTVKIDQEKIGMVIGKGGETIRALEADHEVQIDIEEGGTILIYATDGNKARGRIGLKLIQKHENGSTVSPEELIERAKSAPPREHTEERPRGDRDRRGGRGGRGGRDRERS